MKFIHISDLHIGKVVYQVSLLDDQKYILGQIVEIAEREQPDAILISGDIYDRGVPPAEAVTILDDFIVKLSQIKTPSGHNTEIFIISGNHDSPERLAFGSALMNSRGVHISPVYNGCVKPFVMNDEWGEVLIYMLPFIKPSDVRIALNGLSPEISAADEENSPDGEDQEEKIRSYTEAAAKAIELMNIDRTKRSVLLCHQYVSGGETSESETRFIGGTEAVDPSVFSDFNYVALGHLHKPQRIKTNGGDKNVLYYCGTPLKYSFSETTKKSVAVCMIDGEGVVDLRKVTLVPLRDMRTIPGKFDDIISRDEHSDDYIRVSLTDDFVPSQVYSRLLRLYPNLLTTHLAASSKTRSHKYESDDSIESKDELEIFTDFFKLMNGRELSDEEKKLVTELISDIKQDSLMNTKGGDDNATD